MKKQDLVLMEDALRDATARLKLFRMLIDHSNDGIEVVDPITLRILDVNESECRNLGYTKKEMLAMSIRDIDPVFNAELDKKIKSQMRESGGARFESFHRRKDGSEFPVEVSATLVDLDRAYVLTIVRDITERRRTEAELVRVNRVLRMLSEGNRALLRAESEAGLMQEMCGLITASGGYPLAWIGLLLHDDYKSIGPVAMSGEGEEYIDAAKLSWADVPAGRGPAGEAARTGNTQVVQDVENDARVAPWRELIRKHGYASVISLPLSDAGVVFGVLNIYASEPSFFSNGEIEVLEEMAEDLAFGISGLRTREERDQALTERQYHAEQLRVSMEDTIQAISTVVELRDPYTAGHQRRVANLAASIGREIGLPDEQVHGIHLAGIVHDIGKIRVPAEILSNPGRLNDIEMGLVRMHAQAGYDILKGINFVWPIAQTVLQHHERWDGSGYPQGLKGDAILLEARILGVADVVESMSSHRPYRAGRGINDSLEEIRRNSGVLYAPDVAAACIRLFMEKGYQLPLL